MNLQPLVLRDIPFVFLDTAKSDSQNKYSYLFCNPRKILLFTPGEDFQSFWFRLEEMLDKGYWLAGFFSYEFGYLLETRLQGLLSKKEVNFPLAWLGVFSPPLLLPAGKDPWENVVRGKYRIQNIESNINFWEYCRAIKEIRELIAQGQTYQVNFTFKYKFKFYGDYISFYRDLRKVQPTAYSALLNVGDIQILSLSPELFFRIKSDEIQVEPMKGTTSRGFDLEQDRQKGIWLQNDSKNRAENVMIVDLLRNDLGRISRTGSVKVKELFRVRPLRTVWQMTSLITSKLQPNWSYFDIFKALFPSGSVTGAPKIRTMEIISELEKEPRKVYTGAIGYISPQRRACFNVAIRTMEVRNQEAEFGVGGGIVYDSFPYEEYRETKVKSYFWIKKIRPFQLLESILWNAGRGYYLLDLHLQRLSRSAEYFQIALDMKRIRIQLKKLEGKLPLRGSSKVRLEVDLEGGFTLFWEPLPELKPPLRVKLSSVRVDPGNIFLYHKTTRREIYEKELKKARREGFFEVVFQNKFGELTEGSFSNLFVKIGSQIYTPPVTSGLLPGVLREYFIRSGKVKQRILYPQDLKTASAVYVGNSVRGLLEVNLLL